MAVKDQSIPLTTKAMTPTRPEMSEKSPYATGAPAPVPATQTPPTQSRPVSTATSRSRTSGASALGAPHHLAPPGPPGAMSTSGFSYQSVASNASFISTISQEKAQLKWDSDKELKSASKTLLVMQKWGLLLGLVVINAVIIWASVAYHDSYYFTIVLLTANTAFQVLMIFCIVAVAFWNFIIGLFRKKKSNKPATPETMVYLLPCYNENLQELTRSLESLAAQEKVGDNPKFIMVVVDGNVKGPGMDKTTQEYLLQDIFGPGQFAHFEAGYRAHDGLHMSVDVQHGYYKTIPYLFIGKTQNMGKRDSLCFARSFLYHYNQRSGNMETIFKKELFDYMGTCLMQNGLEKVDLLAGMDADTVFDKDCVFEMLDVLRDDPKLVASCGHVCVDYDGRDWGIWSMYQGFEYSLTQGLRRTFQSVVTGKVNCLPGCCQLIKVTEETFGDLILREKFGYCPKPNDTMTTQIMGIYSEDSVHATTFFSLFPKTQTAQALRAKAFTIVPQNWKVFLSQRKRWSLGSVSNQFTMMFRPGILWIERVLSAVTVITWAITPFTVAAIAQFIIAFVHQGKDLFYDPAFLALFSLLCIKYLYSFALIFWLCRNFMERVQYVLGYVMHIIAGPFINFFIWIYSIYYSDDITWGKTREVIDDEEGGRCH